MEWKGIHYESDTIKNWLVLVVLAPGYNIMLINSEDSNKH